VKHSPRSHYVGLVVMTVAGKSREELRDPANGREGIIASIGAIEEQAASDWRMTSRDVDVVHELADAWIRFIQDGERVGTE